VEFLEVAVSCIVFLKGFYPLSIRCVIGFFIIVFLQGFFIYSPPPIHVYIQTFDPHMNTNVIHNIVYRAKVSCPRRSPSGAAAIAGLGLAACSASSSIGSFERSPPSASPRIRYSASPGSPLGSSPRSLPSVSARIRRSTSPRIRLHRVITATFVSIGGVNLIWF
jgi:hypothetical protein